MELEQEKGMSLPTLLMEVMWAMVKNISKKKISKIYLDISKRIGWYQK